MSQKKHDHKHSAAHESHTAATRAGLHRDWRFWSVLAMLLGLGIYVFSLDEAIEPEGLDPQVPAANAAVNGLARQRDCGRNPSRRESGATSGRGFVGSGGLEGDVHAEACDQCVAFDATGSDDVLEVGLDRQPVAESCLVEDFDRVFRGLAGLNREVGTEFDQRKSPAAGIGVASWEQSVVDEPSTEICDDGIPIRGGPAELEKCAEPLRGIVGLAEQHPVDGGVEAVVAVVDRSGIHGFGVAAGVPTAEAEECQLRVFAVGVVR